MDMGIDDAIALLYLSSQSGVDLAAIGTVHGNVSAQGAAENAVRVLDLVGLPDVPVAVGAARPLVRPARFAPEVHGEDGLGNRRPAAVPTRPVDTPAPEQLVRLARSSPGRYEVFATGPLTNLAIALLLEPDLPTLVRAVTIMGGAASGVGNMTAVAEANIWHDPEAAALVFAAPWPVTMVGLDVTMKTILDEHAIAAIAAGSTPFARFAARILSHYLDFYQSITGRRACPLHDPSAAGVLADPTLVTHSIDADIQVALSDDARGMTIVDRRHDGGPVTTPRNPASSVVLEIDSARFVADLVRVLTT